MASSTCVLWAGDLRRAEKEPPGVNPLPAPRSCSSVNCKALDLLAPAEDTSVDRRREETAGSASWKGEEVED